MRRRIRQLHDYLREQLNRTHEANRAALVLLGFGLGIIAVGFVILYLIDPREGESFSLRQLVSDLYANGGAELLSIALTVLIIESLNRRRAEQERKEELILQMGSPDHGFAIEAVRILDQKDWLGNGSLQDADLREANLQGAHLWQANLQGANLWRANLQRANLGGANLQGALLVGANLKGAHLWQANLHRADLYQANLQAADLWRANLQSANLQEAVLREAKMLGASLEQANLQRALIGVTRLEAILREERRVQGEISSTFDESPICDETTTLPDGSRWTPDRDWREFTHPQEWAVEQATKKRFTFSKPPGFARGE